MTRRAKGEGSVRQRPDGRFEGRYWVTVAGQPRRRSVFGKTGQEAARKLRQALAKVERGESIPPERLTLSAFFVQWLAEKEKTLRPETHRRYKDLAGHVEDVIGKRRVAQVTIDDVRAVHDVLGSRFSATSVQHAHGVLHAALQDALRWGYVSRNVAGLVSAPRRSTREQKHLGADDARALLKAAQGQPLGAFFTLALTAGLREGELQALRWKDVDTARQRVRVVATLVGVKDGEPVLGPPKTQHSRRTVWLSAVAVDALERHQGHQDAMRRLAGDAWQEHGLVFTNDAGAPLWRSQVRKHWLALLEKAELPPMRVHDLRHSAASLLLAEGTPVKVVSELLGHSDVTTTLRIYAHVIEGAQEQAASAMDRLFHA